MKDTKEIIKKRLELEGQLESGPWLGFSGTITLEYLIPPIGGPPVQSPTSAFVAKARNEYRPTNKVVLLLIETLEQVIDVTGTGTLQNKVSREALKKTQEMING